MKIINCIILKVMDFEKYKSKENKKNCMLFTNLNQRD